MRIDDNAEALAMMKRALGSLEGKIREAYNNGYHDGRKEGMNQAKQEMANKILGEIEDEPNCSEKPNNYEESCETCRHQDEEWDSSACDGCTRESNHYEPQTDCSWK